MEVELCTDVDDDDRAGLCGYDISITSSLIRLSCYSNHKLTVEGLGVAGREKLGVNSLALGSNLNFLILLRTHTITYN